MINCFGIIAEFNPFHNGHAALCAFARESGASHVAAVMSGNAVQRGCFAVCDKRIRVKAALNAGVDLVLELPLPYAAATAGRFAAGAVNILKNAGCVDTLCFGSESGDISLLERLSRLLDSAELKSLTRAYLRDGSTFAKARQQAADDILGTKEAAALAEPNNILALEYLREMRAQGWKADAVTMARTGAAHDSSKPGGAYASASYLRSKAEDLEALCAYVPPVAMDIYREAHDSGLFPADAKKPETAIVSHLRRLSIIELKALPDISEGLENRLYSIVRTGTSLEGIMIALKTKRYTLARIRRILLCAYLGVKAEDTSAPPPYMRVLGFNGKGRELLSKMKTTSRLPVHTSLARLEMLSPRCARFAELEARCTDQFSLMLPSPQPCGYEYTAGSVILR